MVELVPTVAFNPEVSVMLYLAGTSFLAFFWPSGKRGLPDGAVRLASFEDAAAYISTSRATMATLYSPGSAPSLLPVVASE